eukprot:CAMPEP_0182916904 /NCGR_PEP_ID=MMETSP0105_2-20130417/1205_1 /TAXON_ID=81532 ORGANISM="Acanthoeca-like sp., Strain 10tr" /NCGR_SAMPLE_ID=MMETSP0105_2 /ASSEMBLY_ACC=CAM_ASM_000205 /LENGTH=938 /DNA_ID=CAMNT_0025053873 /DNA_START=81 /DNA_END=2897 /DNA_ORIENTATION=-
MEPASKPKPTSKIPVDKGAVKRGPSPPNRRAPSTTLTKAVTSQPQQQRQSLAPAAVAAAAPARTVSPALRRKTTGAPKKAPEPPRSPDSDALLSFTHRRAEALQQQVDPNESVTDLDEAELKETGHIRVYARLRPYGDFSRARGDKECITLKGTDKLVVKDENRQNVQDVEYKYDHVFDQVVTQQEVYDEACRPLVDSVIRGYNGTLMAYGQTGSGKTHTMGSMAAYSAQDGYKSASGDGLISKAIDDVFARTEADTEYSYEMFFSYVQIYQEEVYDLLSADAGARTALPLREHPASGIYIDGLKEAKVASPIEVTKLLSAGRRRLVVAETKMNRQSSRSHALATIKVRKLLTRDDPDAEEQDLLVCGRLTLCDLAGSERVKKSASAGQRLSEAQKINLSLLELGNVVSALADPNHTHVPFRNSTLTRLMQESLGGNCKTSLIVCCSTLSRDASETKGALFFGQRAKSVKQKARINVELDYRHLANELAEELDRKTEAWHKKFEKLRTKIEELETELTTERELHTAARDDLTKRLADAHRAREAGVTQVEEDMLTQLSKAEAQAAETEAELKQQIKKLNDRAAAVAAKTAAQMTLSRKNRKSAEKKAVAQVEELRTENDLLKQLVSELEQSVAAAEAETDAHRHELSSTTAETESAIGELTSKLASAHKNLEEAEARATAALTAKIEEGHALAAAREAQVLAGLPAAVEAEVSRLRVDIERDVRAEVAEEQQKWQAAQAAAAEEAKHLLEQRYAEDREAWIAEEEAANEAMRLRLSQTTHEETQRLEQEFDMRLAAAKDEWVSNANRAHIDKMASALAHKAISHGHTEVPRVLERDAAIAEAEGLKRQIADLQRANDTLEMDFGALRAKTETLQSEVKDLRRGEVAYASRGRRATVENAAFQPTRVLQGGSDIHAAPPAAKKKKRRFLGCCGGKAEPM